MVVLIDDVPGVYGATGGGDEELLLETCLVEVNLYVRTAREGVAVLYKCAVGDGVVAAKQCVVDCGVGNGGAAGHRLCARPRDPAGNRGGTAPRRGDESFFFLIAATGGSAISMTSEASTISRRSSG